MSSPSPHPETADDGWVEPPDVSGIVIDNGEPVDGIYSEKQHRLLTEPLYSCWSGLVDEEGQLRPFVATSNVGVFSSPHEPPLVPDVLLSIDVEVQADFMAEKRHRTYFIWEMGKPPDVVIEVVSNREGGELGKRMRGYARMRVAYYVVWDPMGMVAETELSAFELKGDLYMPLSPVIFPSLDLELAPWDGVFENVEGHWLRWRQGGVEVQTGAERARVERERAEAERERADRLVALLREHGISVPES